MTGLIISQGEAVRAWIKERTSQAQASFFPSVRPVYWATPSGTAEAIGSSFLLRVDGKRYFVTAAHVLDLNQQSTLYVGGSNALEPITGIAEVTKAPASGRAEDKFDFAYMELPEDFANRLGVDVFIDVNEISQNRGMLDGRCYMALGYSR